MWYWFISRKIIFQKWRWARKKPIFWWQNIKSPVPSISRLFWFWIHSENRFKFSQIKFRTNSDLKFSKPETNMFQPELMDWASAWLKVSRPTNKDLFLLQMGRSCVTFKVFTICEIYCQKLKIMSCWRIKDITSLISTYLLGGRSTTNLRLTRRFPIRHWRISAFEKRLHNTETS